MNAGNKLQELVVEAVSNGYESFETILEQVLAWVDKDANTSRGEIIKALAQTVSKGYVQSYLLSPREPYSVATEFSIDRLHELWFSATPLGKHFVETLE